MKYLKYFKTEADYNAFIQSEDFILPNVSYAVDANSTFYHVVKTETGDYKILLLEKKNISGLTYNMVDLGLPSGLLWADRNVGASSPEDFGTYFAWGETSGYNVSIKYCTAAEMCAYMQPQVGDEMILTPDNIDEFFAMAGFEGTDLTVLGTGFGTEKCFSDDWSDYFDTTDGGNTFNKYNTNGGIRDLEASDDAATVNMGSEYRMPTKADFQELINNCTVTFIDRQGNEFSQSEAEDGLAQFNFKGSKFTGTNGNSIFIPASGSSISSMILNIWDSSWLWTRLGYDRSANCAAFYYNGYLDINSAHTRYNGFSVRGVKVK